jgi:tripartite-type tricarboxylate transporter receptor subunit TctC
VSRSLIHALVILCSALAAPGLSLAQGFPSKAIHLIVPFPPGGPLDPLARGMQPNLAQGLGQAVVIDNRPGATGTIGINVCATAGTDAHTVCMITQDLLVLRHLMKLPFDIERDLAPVTQLAFIKGMIMTGVSSSFNNFPEMIAFAKANPGKLNFGSFGEGGQAHQLVEAINQKMGTRIVHVPYKGSGPALQGLLAGEVDMALVVVQNAVTHSKSGRLKPLAVFGGKRVPVFPEVGTMNDQGFDLNIRTWFGIVGSARAPKEDLARVSREIARSITTPEYLEKYVQPFYYDIVGSTPEEFAEFMKADRTVAEYLANVVKAAGYTAQ